MNIACVGASLLAMLYALPSILLRALARSHKGHHFPF